MCAWLPPKTNWGQPGQTVPGVDDFNRIEGNIETLGRYDRAPGYGVATGTNAKTITLDPAPTSYYDGMCFAFRNNTENTGPVTINVNGLGARSVKKPNGNDIAAGYLKAGTIYTIRYNATTGNFILQGSDSSGNATPADVRAGKTFSNDYDTELIGTLKIIGETISQVTNKLYINEDFVREDMAGEDEKIAYTAPNGCFYFSYLDYYWHNQREYQNLEIDTHIHAQGTSSSSSRSWAELGLRDGNGNYIMLDRVSYYAIQEPYDQKIVFIGFSIVKFHGGHIFRKLWADLSSYNRTIRETVSIITSGFDISNNCQIVMKVWNYDRGFARVRVRGYVDAFV